MFPGQLTVGSVVSTTVTVCVQIAVFPELSVDTQICLATIVFPHN
jgi:hypothetical protein